MTVEDADIWRYMQIAQISDFVLSLPDQLDSHVGEAGSKLSGGQRQRLSIARFNSAARNFNFR